MTNAILRGNPDAGYPHVRLDEGKVASAKPLLYRKSLVALLVSCTLGAFANEWYVDANNGNDLWDGTSSNHVGAAESTVGPRKTLKGAMEIPTLDENDTVWLLPGDYNEGVMPYFDETPELAMVYAATNRCLITKSGLKIRSTGGKSVTFVTGAKDPVESTFSKAYGGIRCFLIAKEATDVVIEGITIRTGYAPYNQIDTYYCGGGVLDLSSSCWVIDCMISDGHAARGGGQSGGNALRTEYIGAGASGRGSSVYAVGKLVNCVIRTPNGTAPVDGGTPTLVNCLITATTSKHGVSQDAKITAYNSIFVGNSNGNGTKPKSTFSNCVVGPFTNETVTCVSCVTNATVAEVAWASASSPYDWRISGASAARGIGDAAILATVQVPEGYSAFIDLYGRPIPAEGVIAAGPVQPANWYVDAANGGDDHGGMVPSDAFTTIRKAMSVAYDGDVVHVAPGTYGEAEGSEEQANVQTRVVVPQGVRLQADGASGSTVIRGAAASEGDEYGLGTDAVRCVYLSAGATLANFTLTEGRTTAGGSGSAVYAANNTTATVVDCLVTNNFCYDGTLYSGRIVKCRVIDNTSTHYGSLGYGCSYYGCFLDHSWTQNGRALNRPTSIDFCTIGTHHKFGISTKQVLAPPGNGATSPHPPIRNSVLEWGASWAATMWSVSNSIFASDYAFSETNNCLIMSAANMKLSDDGVPTADSPVNNWGNMEFAPDCINETDLAGVPRVMNGGVDAGAFEHDWRAEYRKDLGRHATAVTAASPEVVETDAGTVRIPSGALVGTLKPGEVQLSFTVTGGTLEVWLGETRVGEFTALPGPQGVKLEPTEANNEFRLAFTPSAEGGCAEIARLKGLSGMLLRVR